MRRRRTIIASAFGVHAVDAVAAGKCDCLIVWQHRGVTDVPMEEVITHYHSVDVGGALVRTARGLGISFGDC